MTESPPVLEQPAFRDRSGGLKGFGILLIVIGLGCALLVPFMLLASTLVPKTGPDAPPVAPLLLPCLIYAVLAVVLIWLGIGSIQAQRWARTLIMINAWSGLFCGILGTIIFAMIMMFLMPIPETTPNAGMIRTVASAIAIIFMGIFFIALPGWLAWFYTKKDVQATCEARHPEPSWTDVRPPTVLLLCLWQAFSALMMLVLPLGNHGTIPLFGILFTGLAGIALCLAQGVLLAITAWLFFHLKPAGWWLFLAMLIVMLASGVLNALFLDYGAFYAAMGYSGQQLTQIQQFNFMQGGLGVVFMIFGISPGLGLLLWTRKYFIAPPSDPQRVYL